MLKGWEVNYSSIFTFSFLEGWSFCWGSEVISLTLWADWITLEQKISIVSEAKKKSLNWEVNFIFQNFYVIFKMWVEEWWVDLTSYRFRKMAQVQVMQGMVRETENIEVRYTCDGCGTITKTMPVLNKHIYKEHKVILHVFFLRWWKTWMWKITSRILGTLR